MKTRYIPLDSEAVTRPGIDAVVYAVDLNAVRKLPQAVGYAGKAVNPTFNYTFRTLAQRDEYIDRFFKRLEIGAKYRLDRRAARKQYTHTLQVGDVFEENWGYDQTNVNFYLVVRVPSNKTVAVREITSKSAGESGFMCGHVVPGYEFVKNSTEMIRKVGEGDCISIRDHSCSLWDGKPSYESSYA